MLPLDDSPPRRSQLANPGFPTAGNILLEESPAAGMPSYLTPLIGRDEERRRLADLITSPERPIVVITGAGGIGKTRLAVQVSNDLQRSYRHGTRFLSFASVPPDANLGAAFAWQLGPVSYTHLRAHETDSYLVCR